MFLGSIIGLVALINGVIFNYKYQKTMHTGRRYYLDRYYYTYKLSFVVLYICLIVICMNYVESNILHKLID